MAGPGKGILNISDGAYLAVSSTFFGSATIGANSTLEFQGAATGPGNTIAFTEDNPTYWIQRDAPDRRHYNADTNYHGFLTGGHDHSLWIASSACRHRPQSRQRARGLYDGWHGIRP
jgi:hypothetical protein